MKSKLGNPSVAPPAFERSSGCQSHGLEIPNGAVVTYSPEGQLDTSSLSWYVIHILSYSWTCKSDTTSGLPGAIQAVVQSSAQPECSILLITDNTIQSHEFPQIIEETGVEGGAGVYDLSLEAIPTNTTVEEVTYIMKKFQELSRCLLIILSSVDSTFLRMFASIYLDSPFILWPTKLVVATRLPLQDLRKLHFAVAVTNSVIITQEEPQNEECNIYVIIPYSLRIVKTASWSKVKGLLVTSDIGLFPEKFYILPDGAELMAAAEEYPPHCKLQEIAATETTPERLEFSGPMLITLEILARSMNFTYRMVRPPDMSWGYQLPDGSWVGMVGMVLRKEVDMALGPFGINPLRKSVVDFTRTMLVDYVRIAAKQGKSEVDPWGFIMPLAPSVWAGVLVSLAVIMGIVMTLSHLVPLGDDSLMKQDGLAYIRVFLGQDVFITSGPWWARFMIFAWMLATLILTRSYGGNLMSLLAVRYIPQPLQSLRKVLDDSSVTMVWESNTEYTQYIMSVTSGIFHEVAESEKSGRMAYTTGSDYGITLENLVAKGDHVLIIEDLSLRMLLAEHFTKSGNCEFYMSSELFLPSAMAMITQKNSPLGPAMDERIKALTESGLYTYWINNAVPNSTSCSNPPSRITVESTLKIANIWGMFVMLGGGFLPPEQPSGWSGTHFRNFGRIRSLNFLPQL
ncbi:glutamate receptor ionotropic, delta-1-like [Macrobrachium nipponense]|uniref:glutamate receptor ionotropic, delta-1-like n=1 Tax=Macrobrachium nipponense TaxID=159736 RepID=UPI0030C8D3FA